MKPFNFFKNVKKRSSQKNVLNVNNNTKSLDSDEDNVLDYLNLNSSKNKKSSEPETLDKRSMIEITKKNHADALRKELKFPATLLNDKQLNWYYEIGSSPSTIRHESLIRVAISLISGIICLFFINSFKYAIFGVILLPVLVWVWSSIIVKSQYDDSIFKKQLSFNKFISIVTPYLGQIKDGVSMPSILNDVSKRMDDDATLSLIGKLVSEIRSDPITIKPYSNFAQEMSNTQRANMFMTAMYQMSQGSTSSQTVKNISRQANADLMKQIDKIQERKIKRFNKLPTIMVMDFSIYMIGFLGAILFSILKKVMEST